MLFKDFFSIFNSGGHFVQQSGTICATLAEGSMGNIHELPFLLCGQPHKSLFLPHNSVACHLSALTWNKCHFELMNV